MVSSRNKYKTSREARIANYFVKAHPSLDSVAEQQLVSMLLDVGKYLAEWDLIVEEETRRILRGLTLENRTSEIERIKRSAIERIKTIEPLETSGAIPPGTVVKQVGLMTMLLTQTETHFSDEVALLTGLKEFCTNARSETQRTQIIEQLRKLQHEKSVAYVTDCYFALSLRRDCLLPHPIEPLSGWAFIHECVHDIREWRSDLNNSIFNYFLILTNLSLRELDQRKKFFEGYMLSEDKYLKSWCGSVFQAQSNLIKSEYLSLNEEVDVVRTFLNDLLAEAFDASVKNLDTHILR